jgi:hypothetical protein
MIQEEMVAFNLEMIGLKAGPFHRNCCQAAQGFPGDWLLHHRIPDIKLHIRGYGMAGGTAPFPA